MNQGTIKKVYETFWGQAKVLFRTAGVNAHAHFDVKKIAAAKVAIDTICYLSGCTWKPTSSQRIDILLRSTETYETASEEMCASTVTRADKSRIIQAYSDLAVRVDEGEEYDQQARRKLDAMAALGVVSGFMTHETTRIVSTLKDSLEIIERLSRKHPELTKSAGTIREA